jgi:hypothetical protein
MKLIFIRDRDKKHNFNCRTHDIKRLETIIKLQNQQLLRELSSHYGWNYKELCNQYIPKSNKLI